VNDPLVSVVVPMFNAERYIERCLGSLLSQDFPGWEAVVVDDGSTDGGAEVAAMVAARDARVRIVRQRNMGLPGARNTGIEASRGVWIRFLDADDWVMPGGFERLLGLAGARGAGLVCGAAAYHDEGGRPLGWSFRPGVARVTLGMLVEGHRFQVSAAMVRRDVLGDLRFGEATQGSEDLDLWLRLGERGAVWDATDQEVVAYRLRPAGMSRDHALMGRVAARVVGACFERNPGLESGEPGKRERCLRRIALERATAYAWGARPNVEGALSLWRALRPSAGVPVMAGEAAEAAAWGLPYADCRAPNAWDDEDRAACYARCLSRWWGALARSGDAGMGFERGAVAALAARLVAPADVAWEIVRRAAGLGRDEVVVHGLGRNAEAVVPALVGAGVRVKGYDDALAGGTTVNIGGCSVPVLARGAWADGGVHVVCPMNGGALERGIVATDPGAAIIKWADATTDISGREHDRLLRMWPRGVLGAKAEVAA
jgi:glycosyltransferase involved in cell wall biosynthesis/ribosomal protein S11